VNLSIQDLENAVPLQGMLGYLNFSTGKPDPRFQKQLSDAYGFLAERGAEQPWQALTDLFRTKLAALQAEGGAAFRDVSQAEAVLALFGKVLAAYREHHADLLFHQSDRDLFQPFFLARVFEALLTQGAPWTEERRIVAGALGQLNDFVGHRPVAILETRPKGEPYPHERVRPIPLFIRGAGVAWGRYRDLVQKALDVLAEADASVRVEAYFDPDLLDELALDPRAYDHGHPVNRRPSYVFGEWDPHHLDLQGRYRRYVVRQVTLDALLERIENPGTLDRGEVLFEAAAVLAGTVLMATAMSGGSPSTHDSSVTLATLTPRIARARDAFYAGLIERIGGAHGERLRQEAAVTRQPFGGARQHLTQYLAQHRAAQLQQRQLAILFAEMGFPRASRREAARIPTASVRLLSDILGRLTTGQILADRGALGQAVPLLAEVEDLIRRGIACGAFADPWNILGFQGLFPLFTSREDSIRDTRIDELVHAVEQLFNLYSRLVSEAAAAGDAALAASLLEGLQRQAAWWDRFASGEVGDFRRVHVGETVASAEHVATALARWHERGERTADLAFWREHLEGFQSPKAFALVVDALLRKQDYRAAMALLMNWLGQAERVLLEDGEYSFHALALRWMLGFTGKDAGGRMKDESDKPPLHPSSFILHPSPAGWDAWLLVKKFFDYLEANAEEYWQVPALETGPEEIGVMPREADEEDLFEAAYDDVTYQDSAHDDEEGSVAEGGEIQGEFDLEPQAEGFSRRLRFLSTVARLWQIAARYDPGGPADADQQRQRAETLTGWLGTARGHQQRLLALLDTLHEHPIPAPSGSYDSLVEFDRRRSIKEQLIYIAIGTALDTRMAVGTLEGVAGKDEGGRMKDESDKPPLHPSSFIFHPSPSWEPWAVRLEQALLKGDADEARRLLPPFLEHFREQPLLFSALTDGGRPRDILRVRTAQAVLRALVTNLPRLGLVRETYHLLKTAHAMEQARPPRGRGVTEFNHLFQAGYQAVVEAMVDSAAAADPRSGRDQQLVDLLESLTRPFLALWVEHSQRLQLSTLETVRTDAEWQGLRDFVRRYGGDLFHAKFMTLANLRGILHRGVESYLDYLRDNPDPLHPVRLVEELGREVALEDVLHWLPLILHALVENYEEYKDYNTTTPQSDYGENLHILLDFLRLKVTYERHAWRLRPLVLAHEVLARRGRADLAVSWQDAFTRLTRELAEQYLERLAALERTHGVRLRTVADRLGERFVKPLALDRLCALIEPAMHEARRPEGGRTFIRLERELRPLTATPTGVGLDVPQWLRRLDAEVQRVRAAQAAVAVLAEGFLRVPRQPLSLAELQRQMDEWEKPLP
jgi:hypothetical protein